jgi:hypothetical protein
VTFQVKTGVAAKHNRSSPQIAIEGMGMWVRVIGAASVAGIAIGFAMVYIAIQHNPQGAIVNQVTGLPDYPYLAGLLLSWFMLISLAVGCVLTLIRWLASRLKRLPRISS